MSRRLAAVDFGSNTVGFLVVELDAEGARELARESRYVRLSEGLGHSSRLAPGARARTRAWVEEIAREFDRLDVEGVRAVATEALRRVEDGDEFRGELGAVLGWPIELLDGEEEAELAFRGVRWGKPLTALAVLDIGGASSELAIGEAGDDAPRWWCSLPVGAVVLTERHGEDLAALRAAVRDELPEQNPSCFAEVLSVLGGTARNLVALDRGEPDEAGAPVHGRRIARARLEELVPCAAALSPRQRQSELGIPSGRADLMMAGFAILDQSLRFLGLGEVETSTDSLRHGVLQSMLRPGEHGMLLGASR